MSRWPEAMLYYISGFQDNALGFFRDTLGASTGREGIEEKAKAPDSPYCTLNRVHFVRFIRSVLK